MSSVEEELKVEVRSAEGVEITYPIHLYAFNETGKLAATQTVDDADEEMALPMAKGDYKVVALSGFSEEYQIPDKPSLNDVPCFAAWRNLAVRFGVGAVVRF